MSCLMTFFLLICSKLIGKAAGNFPEKFKQKMYDLFLQKFPDREYGRNEWVKIQAPEGVIYQQNTPVTKRAQSENSLIPLTSHGNRFGIRMFYRPSQKTQSDTHIPS